MNQSNQGNSTLSVLVHETGPQVARALNATLELTAEDGTKLDEARTGPNGIATFANHALSPGKYKVRYRHVPEEDFDVEVDGNLQVNGQPLTSPVALALSKLKLELQSEVPGAVTRPLQVGDWMKVSVYTAHNQPLDLSQFGVTTHEGKVDADKRSVWYLVSGRRKAALEVLAAKLGGGVNPGSAARYWMYSDCDPADTTPTQIAGNIQTNTTLSRTSTAATEDLPLWQAILNSTESLSFNNYLRFMDFLFCGGPKPDAPFEKDGRLTQKQQLNTSLLAKRLLPFTDTDAYRVVKAATEAFVMVNCGVLMPPRPFDPARDAEYFARRDLPAPGNFDTALSAYLDPIVGADISDGKPHSTLPYLAVIRNKLPDIGIKLQNFEDTIDPEDSKTCNGFLQQKLENPCLLELIWSYWHEEGMMVQTINAITRRFQNVRGPGKLDPLANLEIDPLRPLNNLLWGYLQDEQHRLSVVRRNYEYDHQYGLRLMGKAVRDVNAADSRSRFIEAFHHLLRLTAIFYRQDDDTTVKADAFPVLNALKEVHLILSQGAHNQFGDLSSTARVEMLLQQWLLARGEFREFLPTRIMVAYPEPWMDRVDAMKKLQGWTDTSVLHFRNLGIFGEQVLLAVRFGNWSDVQEPLQAFNWARFFRPQIQGYLHAYRAATGVDLTADLSSSKIDTTPPSVLLMRQLEAQRRGA
jgi:hypothetical protein